MPDHDSTTTGPGGPWPALTKKDALERALGRTRIHEVWSDEEIKEYQHDLQGMREDWERLIAEDDRRDRQENYWR